MLQFVSKQWQLIVTFHLKLNENYIIEILLIWRNEKLKAVSKKYFEWGEKYRYNNSVQTLLTRNTIIYLKQFH